MPKRSFCKEEIPGRNKKPNGEAGEWRNGPGRFWCFLLRGSLTPSPWLAFWGQPLKRGVQPFSKKPQGSPGSDRDAPTRLQHLGAPAAAVSQAHKHCFASKLWVWRSLVAQGDQAKVVTCFLSWSSVVQSLTVSLSHNLESDGAEGGGGKVACCEEQIPAAH